MIAVPAFARATAIIVVGLGVLYAATLTVGLAARPSADAPIGPPWFTLMELLILAIGPAMLALVVAIHALAPPARRPAGVLAIAFMAICVGLTGAVHVAILSLAGLPQFASPFWQTEVFAFRWPSLVYALDILAWDVFFALGAASAALALPAEPRWRAVRRTLFAAAAFAAAGLAGMPLADMRVRNIGIVGYAALFPLAAALLLRALGRAPESVP